jgi:transposase InsO family protein
MKLKKKQERNRKKEESLMKFYNQHLPNSEIAEAMNRSIRTIYRWKSYAMIDHRTESTQSPQKRTRKKLYKPAIFNRMIALKQELSCRSAATIFRLLRNEFPDQGPSESTIRKYLIAQGFSFKKMNNRQGYIKFQRDKPNDLWQIDIAGGQSITNLGIVYLVAILDDCSRFIISAQYFSNQTGVNVLKVVRDGIMQYGRPNQIIADNGKQFRNSLKEYESRYINMLKTLGVDPIFSRKNHPQSKGKIERLFETVISSFLLEARPKFKANSELLLGDLNTMLQEWVRWYNTVKPHRSLPKKQYPATIYNNHPQRISRPLEALIDWNLWINSYLQRKVTKYNTISFKNNAIQLPEGYVGCQVDLLELEDRIEIYHNDGLVFTHLKSAESYFPADFPIIRTIAHCGTIKYKKHTITIDYKLAGKKVEIHESNGGSLLLIYLEKRLLKQIKFN